MARIKAAVDAGDFSSADDLCAELVAVKPDHAGLWNMRAGLRMQAKDVTGAETYFRRAITLAPQASAPWMGLARLYAAPDPALAAGAAAEALQRGLGEEEEIAAREIVAYGRFASGDGAEGRAELIALLPYYRKRCGPRTRDAQLHAFRALVCAMCAGDAEFAEHLLRLLYPHAADLGPIAIAATDDIAHWCRRHTSSYRVIDPGEDVDLRARSPHGRDMRYRTDPVIYAAIPGGRFIPRFDFAIASDGTVLRDTGYMSLDATFNFLPHTCFEPAKLIVHHAPRRHEDVDAEVLLLSAPPDGNFGHWLIDFLPRLQGLGHVPPRVRIAMPEPLQPKQAATLQLCGIDPGRVLLCRTDTQYRFRMLHLYLPGRAMPPQPASVRYLRQNLFTDAPVKLARPASKRVYLSRGRVGTRLIVNSDEFNAVLREEGFVTADMAEMTIDQQRELLRDAEILVGTMGTNLLALYLAPSSCKVIGIIDDPAQDPLIAPTAAILGMSCEYLIARRASASAKALHDRDADFSVDCAVFRQRLREIEARSE